jgi:D-inositol-3-phosphate glycosyltransferase
MNIAMVSVHASPLHAGVPPFQSHSLHVAELARELGRQGHEVTIYTHRSGIRARQKVEFAPGVTVEHVRAGNTVPMSEQEMVPNIPEFAKRLAKRWAKDRPDVVHAHHWLSGLAALSAARDLDIPVVQTFHDLATLERRAGLARSDARARMEQAIGRNAHAVIATTGSESAGLVDLGVPRKHVTTVPSGIDIEKFNPGAPASPRGSAARIIMITRPSERQGVDTVIKAMARVPGAELVLAGGPSSDELNGDQDVHRLQIVAKEAGVEDRVTFLGRVDPAKIPGLLRSADLTVSLPSYETFGRVPIESMACGTPVLVSPVGGHLDSVVDDVTGVQVQPGRPAELARMIRGLLSEPTHLASLGIAGADRVRSRYSWERIATETLKVYTTLLPQPIAPEEELAEADIDAEDAPVLAAAS